MRARARNSNGGRGSSKTERGRGIEREKEKRWTLYNFIDLFTRCSGGGNYLFTLCVAKSACHEYNMCVWYMQEGTTMVIKLAIYTHFLSVSISHKWILSVFKTNTQTLTWLCVVGSSNSLPLSLSLSVSVCLCIWIRLISQFQRIWQCRCFDFCDFSIFVKWCSLS